MKVVVSVQAKQGSSRGLVHYVAHSKIDEQRESPTREIFSERADQMTVEKANAFLSGGAARKRAGTEDLHHLVISLKPEDYERLGENEKERQASVKEITREAMKNLAEAVGAERLAWTAAVHRNTDNPHVHVALSKEFFDKSAEKKILNKIPTNCLPHYEKTEAGEKVFASGVLIEAAVEKLDALIAEKSKAQVQSKNNDVLLKNERNKSTEIDWRINSPTGAKIRQSETEPNNKSTNERDILARAIFAKYFLDTAKENLESLTEHGAFRRFLIYDEVSGQKRRLSLFDLERRAEKNARRELRKSKITDDGRRDEIEKKLVVSEMEKNTDGIKRIKTILHNLIIKENQNLRTREKDYEKIKPQAEEIRRWYRRENKKLPVPNLTENEIEMLQTRSIEKRDIRAANYFERVRRELADERGTPTRNDEAIKRLKLAQILSELKAKSLEKQLKDSKERKRHLSIEIDGKKWSLGKADALITKSAEDENRIGGKISKILGKIGIVENKNVRAELEEIKTKIVEKLGEKIENISDELRRETAVGKMLNEFYKSDTNPEKENLRPKPNAAQLAEIESLAFELKLADVYRENFAEQKQFINLADGNAKNSAEIINESKEKTIAGRAVARALLCEIEAAKAKENLADFQKNKRFQKFEIADGKTGESKFVSLRQVEFDARGSILDQTLEFFTENFEKRRTRWQLEKLIKEKSIELKENLRAARAMEKSAATDVASYIQKSFFGSLKFSHAPVFTPKETVAVELRIRQTENKSEAAKLQKILDAADHSKSKNLLAILSVFSAAEIHKTAEQTAKAKDQPIAQTAVESETRIETTNPVRQNENLSPRREEREVKTENKNLERGR